jgi:hypothetical protein
MVLLWVSLVDADAATVQFAEERQCHKEIDWKGQRTKIAPLETMKASP